MGEIKPIIKVPTSLEEYIPKTPPVKYDPGQHLQEITTFSKAIISEDGNYFFQSVLKAERPTSVGVYLLRMVNLQQKTATHIDFPLGHWNNGLLSFKDSLLIPRYSESEDSICFSVFAPSDLTQ